MTFWFKCSAGGIFINAGNIIPAQCHGDEYGDWGGTQENRRNSSATAFLKGPLPENPPQRDMIVQDSIVCDTGRYGTAKGAEVKQPAPRCRYAIHIGPWSEGGEPSTPLSEGLHFGSDSFHPGTADIPNVELTP